MKSSYFFRLIFMSILVLNPNAAISQWSQISQIQNAPITSFLVMSDSLIFVGGYFHFLYRSADGGENWSYAGGQIPADTILSLASAGKYIFAGTNVGVSRSSDYGETWESVNPGLPTGGFNVNQFANLDTVLFAATATGIFRTTDFGTSWSPIDDGLETYQIQDTVKIVAQTLGIAATRSNLFTTQDLLGGAYRLQQGDTTWHPIGLRTRWSIASALIAYDTSIFAGTSDGVFMYSGNDTTWIPRNNGLPGDPVHLQFCFFAATDTLLFIHIGYVGGAIYATSDLGQVWTLVSANGLYGTSVSALVATRKYLFAGTQEGVYRMPLADVATSITDRPSELPLQCNLFQNFPNPFNPSTVIKYQTVENGHVTLTVYDVLGREITVLRDGQENAGTHSVVFNAANLASGIYYYRLQAGTYVKTKKLLIVK